MASHEKAEATPLDPLDSSADELVGRCLNDTYVIEGVIGEGGVGRVYRARHARIRTKRYALKVLHAEYGRDPQHLARFQQEAEAAATLSHPNVVGVFDVGRTEDGYSYLACELLSGIDLDAYLETKGKLTVSTAIWVALQICDALATAHARNIIHRDLKPQNVFLLNAPDGTIPQRPSVKLLDFGLSRFLDQVDTQLTKTGTVMGTPAFMAPEQASGNRGDHRVDIYGIGVILYASLTGQPPFMKDTLPAILYAVTTEEAPRPTKLAPEIPEALELLIQKAMAKDPNDRYQSVDELRKVLQGIYDSLLTPSMFPAALTRPHMASLVQAEDNHELRTSRPRLVAFFILLTAFCIAFITSAVSGLEIFTGPLEFSKTELVLVVLGVCGTILSPAVLALRHFQKTIWSNSAKVVALLARLRDPLVAGLVTYGSLVILLRFLDDFVSRLVKSPLFMREPGLAWPGFTWVLPAVALLVASSAYARRRLSEGPQGVKRRLWLGLPLTFGTLTLAGAMVFLALQWRAFDVSTRTASEPPGARNEASPSAATAAEPAPTAEVPPPEPIRLASDEELASAMEQGLDGLLPLSEKYPKDARVLEPLLLAFASRATGLADAMVTAKRLLEVAPEKRDNAALGVIVRRAAETPGNASDLAFSLMRDELGPSGADYLYQLKRAGDRASARAAELLASEEMQSKISPALRVALELEAAKSCEDRLPMLARAAHLGDNRAISILAPLAQGTKTGCGRWKRSPCPPVCKDHAKEYRAAVMAIQARLTTSSL